MSYVAIIKLSEFRKRVSASFPNGFETEDYMRLVGITATEFRNQAFPGIAAKAMDDHWPEWISVAEDGLDAFGKGGADSPTKFNEEKLSKLRIGKGSPTHAFAVHYRLQLKLTTKESDALKAIEAEGLRFSFEDKWGPVLERVSEPIVPNANIMFPRYWTFDDVRDKLKNDPHDGVWLDPHNHHSIKMSERKKEWKRLDEFMLGDEPFRICPIIGPSGAGKTRLVSEWMKSYVPTVSTTDWEAGFVTDRDPSYWTESSWSIRRDTLIVIDYTFAYEEVVKEIARTARRNKTAHKVRLIVLDHVFPHDLFTDEFWKNAYKSSTLKSYSNNELTNLIELGPEHIESCLLRDVVASTASTSERTYDPDDPIIIDAVKQLHGMGESSDNNRYSDENAVRHPLFAALLGQAISEGRDSTNWNRRELIQYYFSNDDRLPWRIWAKGNMEYRADWGNATGALVSAATLRRGIKLRHVESLLPGNIAVISQYANRIVSGEDHSFLKPFEPDILGEAFILLYLAETKNDKGAREKFVEILSATNVVKERVEIWRNVHETLIRLIRNLAKDDQFDQHVIDAWETLVGFLNPSAYHNNNSLRHVISNCIPEVMEQQAKLISRICGELNDNDEKVTQADTAGLLDELESQFSHSDIERMLLSSEPKISAKAYLQYLEYTRDVEVDSKIVDISKFIDKCVFEQHELPFYSLHASAAEGRTKVFKKLLTRPDLDANVRSDDGATPLMFACWNNRIPVVEHLLNPKNACDIDAVDSDGRTALIVACAQNHVAVVKTLLEASVLPDVNLSDLHGWNALLVASERGHCETLRLLLEIGRETDINSANDHGSTALNLASGRGHFESVVAILEAGFEVDVNARDNDGRTALMSASANGHTEVVEALTSSFFDIDTNIATDDGHTALMLACQHGHTEVVRCLLRPHLGIDTNAATNDGETALMYASLSGSSDIVDELLAPHLNTNEMAESKRGNTALIYACKKGNLETVDRLLKSKLGNVPDKKGPKGMTALICAAGHGHPYIVERLIFSKVPANVNASVDDGRTAFAFACAERHLDVVEVLLKPELNVDINAKIEGGWNAFTIACWAGNFEIVDLLLQRDLISDVNAVNENGRTGLMEAAANGHLNIVSRLVGIGNQIDLSVKDVSGFSAFLLACGKGNLDVVNFLLQHRDRFDVNASDQNGLTPFMYASGYGHIEIVERLLDPTIAVDVNAVDEHGNTSLIRACLNVDVDVVEKLLSINSPVNVNIVNNVGVSGLMLACSRGEVEIVSKFVETRLELEMDLGGKNGWTALMFACGHGHLAVVELLLAHGADINSTDDDGDTALIAASSNGQTKVVEILLRNSSLNITHKNDNNRDALSFAVENGHDDIRKMIDYAILETKQPSGKEVGQ